MRYVVFGVALVLCVSTAWAVKLQDVYDQAGPGEGYDKLVVLDPNVTYTGRCDVLEGKKSCIRGNGALIDLQFGQVVASGTGTELLITGCCLVEGNAAIAIQNGATGIVDGNTICKSGKGVQAWQSLSCTIKNNILYDNDYGIAREENTSTTILYNDVDSNSLGNYVYWCPG
ncbi:MAG: right-handed parallel beta-helix repeat-containing protein [Candidatus Coatesbacteria bacterium]|nr:MAG: right-handed parallel beta-helix repeat-containing protein [Candidatus Coatesbacteria bacterium]